MITFKYPEKTIWASLCERPVFDFSELSNSVNQILQTVRDKGDEALLRYSEEFDQVALDAIKIDLKGKSFEIDPQLAEAIELAKSNIEKFHEAQQESVTVVETTPGVTCWRKSLPIQNVGLYVPGGSAPLFSSLLMLAIPAKIAGCENIVVCTPPQKAGGLNEVIGWTCQLLGIESIYLTGGAQAVAAMTFGTESVPKVDKIFGPGNQFVTAAKQKAQEFGVAIDMPACPSEVLVIADEHADPSFVAADLLSQAEHGPDSQVILVSDAEYLIEKTEQAIQEQLKELPRKSIAEKALENSKSVLLKNMDEVIEFSNLYAPEHLIINTANCDNLAEQITIAGSVFLGSWSCESAGDYASGTNHTLPTNGYARNYSGVSLDSFIKKITFQQIYAEGMGTLGPAIEKMAEAEQLQAHKHAVTLRLNALKNV
jgi:histidinol dehydrogenase